MVIPCFNESEGLPRLETELHSVEKKLSAKVEARWIFVNDGSADNTGDLLDRMAKNFAFARVIHHDRNKNLGAALRSGILRAPESDFIAFLDSDCTYSPQILLPFLDALEQGAEFVVASPYHPLGKVEGVPPWRLGLSRGLSFLYRLATGSGCYTYTSMVRAMRFPIAQELVSERDDFTSVAEMMLNACLRGYKVREIPALLQVRIAGFSKMKLIPTILSHIGLLASLLLRKLIRA